MFLKQNPSKKVIFEWTWSISDSKVDVIEGKSSKEGGQDKKQVQILEWEVLYCCICESYFRKEHLGKSYSTVGQKIKKSSDQKLVKWNESIS